MQLQRSRRMIRRRDALLTALPAAASACSLISGRYRGHTPNRRIVIVGGGLSGLATAHGLSKIGREVIVLEADERPGGRILTLRKPFSNGLFVEAGAKHVVGDPDLLAFIQEMGVSLARVPSRPKLPDARILKGRRFREDEPDPSVAALLARQRQLGFGALRPYLGEVKSIGDPRAVGWPSGAALPLDRVSFERFLLERGASEEVVDSLRGSDITAEPDQLSALNVLRDWHSISGEMKLRSPGQIEGGTDQLPRAAAQKLGDRVIYGAVVRRVEDRHDGAAVTFTQKGQTVTLTADRVVVAIPFSVLRSVEVAAPLSEAKRRAIESMRYMSVTRGFVEVRDRPWLARGESGRVNTDLPIHVVREESEFSTTQAAVLGSFISGPESRRLCALGDDQRLNWVREQMEIAHPGLATHVVGATVHCWDSAPFAKGAYAVFGPGEMKENVPVAPQAERRLHFAGCHTSYRPGFMHGAIASARRVVNEVQHVGS
jgi:monoamine oxidase